MTATTVIDSPEFVLHYWADSVLNSEFMDYAETDLTAPAVRVVNRLLTDEWNRRGYRMVPLRIGMYQRIAEIDTLTNPAILPAVSMSNEVWDTVVEQLEFDDIVAEARLTREYAAFVRAQPDYNH